MIFSEFASNAQESPEQKLKRLRSELASNTLSPVRKNQTIQDIIKLEESKYVREIIREDEQQQPVQVAMTKNTKQEEAAVPDEMNLDFTQPGAMPSIPGIEVSEVEMAPGDFSQQGHKLEDIKGRLLKMKALLENANPITKPIIEERVKVLEATHAKLTEGEENTAPSTPSLNTTFVDTSDPNAFDNDPVIRTMDRQEKRSEDLRKSLGIE